MITSPLMSLANGMGMLAAAVSEVTFLDRVTAVMIDVGIVIVIAGMLFCIARLLLGPHLTDRAVAVDTLTIHLVALVILLTMRAEALIFFDGALALSVLGFVSAVAMGQFVIRRRLRELNVHEEIATGDASQLAPDGKPEREVP